MKDEGKTVMIDHQNNYIHIGDRVAAKRRSYDTVVVGIVTRETQHAVFVTSLRRSCQKQIEIESQIRKLNTVDV